MVVLAPNEVQAGLASQLEEKNNRAIVESPARLRIQTRSFLELGSLKGKEMAMVAMGLPGGRTSGDQVHAQGKQGPTQSREKGSSMESMEVYRATLAPNAAQASEVALLAENDLWKEGKCWAWMEDQT